MLFGTIVHDGSHAVTRAEYIIGSWIILELFINKLLKHLAYCRQEHNGVIVVRVIDIYTLVNRSYYSVLHFQSSGNMPDDMDALKIITNARITAMGNCLSMEIEMSPWPDVARFGSELIVHCICAADTLLTAKGSQTELLLFVSLVISRALVVSLTDLVKNKDILYTIVIDAVSWQLSISSIMTRLWREILLYAPHSLYIAWCDARTAVYPLERH